jgi:hypothetical protein
MNTAIEYTPEDLSGSALPSQYNDLIRRRSSVSDGEYRLLWAVLEDAIRTYLANRACSNPIQRKKFEEVRRWFEPASDSARGLFGYQTICDLLEIDPGRLLKGLKCLDTREFPPRRHRLPRNAGARRMAA